MADKKQEDAVEWFIGKARTAAGYRRTILQNNPNRDRSSAVMGKMFFFAYDPKHKLKLPIYDKFPLVFPMEPKPGGFLGLNVHYLSPDERNALLGGMFKFANNTKNDETTRLRITYDLVNDIKGLSQLAQQCVKRYLYGHVRSPFVEIHANEWDKVMALPLELFITKK